MKIQHRQRRSRFYGKIFFISVLLIVVIAVASLSVVYYWSFYHYNRIFEDRVIDEYTLKNAESIGIENEWILGINTKSIDVLEVIYNKEVSEHIHRQALSQEELSKIYREKIDHKDLIYCISLDVKDGEYIYKYSVIRDLYHEVFPHIVFTMVLFLGLVVLALYLYVQFIDKQFYQDLVHLQNYAKKLETLDLSMEPMEYESDDKIISALTETFRHLHAKLSEKDALQKSSLQYISHEMKSPIMIIESYVVSAKDGIYPHETLDASFDTILAQTQRMKEKVTSLMDYITLSTMNVQKQSLDLSKLIRDVLSDHQAQLKAIAHVVINLEETVYIHADADKMRVVLENLLENQLKYCQKEIAVRLLCRRDKIRILFYNDGNPISPELKTQIFTPFIKGYNGSNGLGLSICKTILLQHGGSIELLPSKMGCLFCVELNQALSELPSPEAHRQGLKKSAGGRRKPARKN